MWCYISTGKTTIVIPNKTAMNKSEQWLNKLERSVRKVKITIEALLNKQGFYKSQRFCYMLKE